MAFLFLFYRVVRFYKLKRITSIELLDFYKIYGLRPINLWKSPFLSRFFTFRTRFSRFSGFWGQDRGQKSPKTAPRPSPPRNARKRPNPGNMRNMWNPCFRAFRGARARFSGDLGSPRKGGRASEGNQSDGANFPENPFIRSAAGGGAGGGGEGARRPVPLVCGPEIRENPPLI